MAGRERGCPERGLAERFEYAPHAHRIERNPQLGRNDEFPLACCEMLQAKGEGICTGELRQLVDKALHRSRHVVPVRPTPPRAGHHRSDWPMLQPQVWNL